MAPLAARALVKHSMNATRAAKELRPHLTEQSARKTGSRMIHSPAVLAELQKLTDESGLSERNAKVYLDKLWDWLLGDDQALKLTAARLLGRRYLKEPIVEPASHPGERLAGFDDDLIKKLTGLG